MSYSLISLFLHLALLTVWWSEMLQEINWSRFLAKQEDQVIFCALLKMYIITSTTHHMYNFLQQDVEYIYIYICILLQKNGYFLLSTGPYGAECKKGVCCFPSKICVPSFNTNRCDGHIQWRTRAAKNNLVYLLSCMPQCSHTLSRILQPRGRPGRDTGTMT